MAEKQFRAESQRILDLMIHSVYSNKEIFLRELISNASDAIDKLYYNTLKEGVSGLNREDFAIEIIIDKAARRLTIKDNGCGMTEAELEENLGTIAHSGTLEFRKENTESELPDVIGQFGVGFYSAFMVAKHICVLTRAYGSKDAYLWESDGAEGYTITPAQKADHGTEITLDLRDNSEEENFDEFLEQYTLQAIVRKHSDYIRYPIKMDLTLRRPKEGSEEQEFEEYTENRTLNSMVPLWKKSKSEVTDEDYNEFYKTKFNDFTDPLRVISSNVEGTATYNALLFIPGRAPYNYYSREYEKGLKLYTNGVLIMDCCKELLPDYFSFVKGLVDSQDLSLNISREILQQDRQVKFIASRLEKKIKSELETMLRDDREHYDTFFKAFGLQLKFGVYSDYGAHKEFLQDLLMFYSAAEEKLITLDEYVSHMAEGQKYIYYASGEDTAKIARMPQTERVRDKGYDILFLSDDVDEFALTMMHEYKEFEFRSVSGGEDLGIEDEEEKKETEKQAEENKDMLAAIKETLGDKVKEVRATARLKSYPVCLTSEGMLSIEMERVLNSMPSDNKVKADYVLELNVNHPLFGKLATLHQQNPDKLATYANLLLDQARLIEGLPVEDPIAFANAMSELMAENVQ